MKRIENKEQIITLYQEGKKWSEIRLICKVSKNTVWRVLGDLKNRVKRFDEKLTEIVQFRYDNGDSLKLLASEYGYSLSALRPFIKRRKRLKNVTIEQTRKRRVGYVTKRRRKLKTLAVEYKGGKCIFCGYNKCQEAMDFHHINPSMKEYAISGGGHTKAWEKIKIELDKCILVCRNCHSEIHAGLITVNLQNLDRSQVFPQ